MATYYPTNDNEAALRHLREEALRKLKAELEAIQDLEDALEDGGIAIGPIAELPPALTARTVKDDMWGLVDWYVSVEEKEKAGVTGYGGK